MNTRAVTSTVSALKRLLFDNDTSMFHVKRYITLFTVIIVFVQTSGWKYY